MPPRLFCAVAGEKSMGGRYKRRSRVLLRDVDEKLNNLYSRTGGGLFLCFSTAIPELFPAEMAFAVSGLELPCKCPENREMPPFYSGGRSPAKGA